MGKLIRLYIAHGNHFERSKFELAVKAKNDRVHQRIVLNAFAPQREYTDWARSMINLNIIFRKPVSVQINGKSAKQNGERNQQPDFPCHTFIV